MKFSLFHVVLRVSCRQIYIASTLQQLWKYAVINMPYFRYYKPPLHLFFSPFGAASIQGFVHFPIFSTVKLHFGAASIQGGFYSRGAYNSENTNFIL